MRRCSISAVADGAHERSYSPKQVPLKKSRGRHQLHSGRRNIHGSLVYVEGGSSIGIGTATTFAGAQRATTAGMVLGVSTTASGTYIGPSPSGATLRCSYEFSEMNLKGIGTCLDSKGETYDAR